MPINITKENIKKEIEHATKPVVLDVYASWCGPCQQMEPIFNELEQELQSDYVFAKLNVDEGRDLSVQFGVTSVPTFIFINNNEIQGRETGSISKEDLREKIKQYLG